MQPPEGPPDLHRLERAAALARRRRSRRRARAACMPIGTSTRPVLFTLPTSEKILVPLLPSVPTRGVRVGAVGDDSGTLAQVSTLLMLVGLPKSPLDGGERRARPRHAAAPFDAGDERRLLAADERARALLMTMSNAEARCRGCCRRAGPRSRIWRSRSQPLDRQRILGADVDVAVRRADGVGADDHPLEDAVRVALEQRAVHERAGVALVGVADHVLRVARRGAAEPHFCPVGNPPPPRPRSPERYLVDHLLGLMSNSTLASAA